LRILLNASTLLKVVEKKVLAEKLAEVEWTLAEAEWISAGVEAEWTLAEEHLKNLQLVVKKVVEQQILAYK
jgi:hypothetical protein